jgi:uncharacterized protein (TIGR03435 family)
MSIKMSSSRNRILASLLIVAGTVFTPALAPSQINPGPVPFPPDVNAKTYTFEVASIRQTKPPGQPHFGPTPDGYQATNLPLLFSVLMANLPLSGEAYFTMDHIKGAPDWLTSDRYNLDAKVSETDLPAWQKPDQQKLMIPAMLQALLVERCKLATHRETKESAVFEMQVGKSGLKLKETAPDAAPPPAGISLPGGGTLLADGRGDLTFYGATMASLAQVMSNFSGRPVKDKTGLTGKYDFVLQRAEAEVPTGAMTPGDPGPPAYAVEALGLHLERSKSMVDTLVIDHIERPSEN